MRNNQEPALFAKRLRAERVRLNLSQEQAALLAGTTRVSWSYYETGAQSPSVDLLVRLAKAGCGFDCAYLVSGLTDSQAVGAAEDSVLLDYVGDGGKASTLRRMSVTRQWLITIGADPAQVSLCLTVDDGMSPDIKKGDVVLLDTRTNESIRQGLCALGSPSQPQMRHLSLRLDGSADVTCQNKTSGKSQRVSKAALKNLKVLGYPIAVLRAL